MEALRSNLVQEKTLDLVLEHAEITEVAPEPESGED